VNFLTSPANEGGIDFARFSIRSLSACRSVNGLSTVVAAKSAALINRSAYCRLNPQLFHVFRPRLELRSEQFSIANRFQRRTCLDKLSRARQVLGNNFLQLLQ
jgi:hypothetical protein